MKYLPYLLFLILLVSSCKLKLNPEKTNAHKLAGETRAYLIPITNAVPAKSYHGFQDKEKKWSIAVKYLKDPMEYLVNTYTKENMRAAGYSLQKTKDILFKDKYPGLWVEYEDKKRQLTRYYMCIDLEVARLTVKGNLPTFQVSRWGLDVKESMQSIYVDDDMDWLKNY